MKKKVLASIMSAVLACGIMACGATSIQTVDGAVEAKAQENEAKEQANAEAAAEGETKEETNMSVVLNGSQKAVIVGQDWGHAVTKTRPVIINYSQYSICAYPNIYSGAIGRNNG